MPLSATSATTARTTFDRIVHVETMLWNRCDEEVRKQIGQPLARLEVLRVIADVAQCRVNDIAYHLQITVGAASKLVDRLEASGHCRRHPNPEDRRSSLLSVTDLGQTALIETQNIVEPLLKLYFATTNLEQLDDTLIRIEQLLRRDARDFPEASQ